MKRKSKLLNVVSIIIIVLSALGLLGTLATIAMSGMLEPYLEAYGVAPLSAGDYVFSLLLTVIQLAAGIMGVMYRSKKSVLIIGVIYCISILANIAISTVTVGFMFTYVFNLILPILYMWGWYQAE